MAVCDLYVEFKLVNYLKMLNLWVSIKYFKLSYKRVSSLATLSVPSNP